MIGHQWGSPIGIDPNTGGPLFARIIVLGSSVAPRQGLAALRDEIQAHELDVEADRLVRVLDHLARKVRR